MEYREQVVCMSNTHRHSRLDWNNKISEEVRGLQQASWVQEGFVGKRPVQELLAIVLDFSRGKKEGE